MQKGHPTSLARATGRRRANNLSAPFRFRCHQPTCGVGAGHGMQEGRGVEVRLASGSRWAAISGCKGPEGSG